MIILHSMFRDRITNWRKENPKEYAEARRKNQESIKSKRTQTKRKASLEKWKKKNPDKYREWQDKLITSRTRDKANNKRKESLRRWNKNNPEKSHENAKKRAQAAALKNSKGVSMIDLGTGKILKEFPSQHAAARWLVEKGKAKNTNCVSSINAVCLKKKCTTGYGYRKKAHGFGWCFTDEIQSRENNGEKQYWLFNNFENEDLM